MPENTTENTDREANFNQWLQAYQAGLTPPVSPITWMLSPPTPEQLDVWREQYGDIYTVVITDPDGRVTQDSKVYIYRGLLYREYTEIAASAQSAAAAEEETVKVCVLHPKIIDTELPTMPAGLVATLFSQVERASMWSNATVVGKV